MSANERMGKVEAALKDRGVRDVKFFFNLGAADQASSDVGESVCRVLEAYLAGQHSKMNALGDAAIA